MQTERARHLGRRLAAWYGAEGRTLPWRTAGDAYAVLVSEVMLQQTQVSRVVPAYTAFLARYPTPGALAAASLADVLVAWRGLGYNRRARNLHAAAAALVDRHAGKVPADLPALRALPGVGDYTARAVLAFGFDLPAAPVDTNVGRVLSRAVAGAPLGRVAGQRLADDALAAAGMRPGAWSHALMDLGATVCTARAPRCGTCPVAAACAWRAAGGPDAAGDPAARTASRSRPQAAFAGSDRYHRGRLVDALREGPLPAAALAAAARCDDPPRLERVVARLVADGLAEWADGRLALPGAAAGGTAAAGTAAGGAAAEAYAHGDPGMSTP